jgi:hypothetical protein
VEAAVTPLIVPKSTLNVVAYDSPLINCSVPSKYANPSPALASLGPYTARYELPYHAESATSKKQLLWSPSVGSTTRIRVLASMDCIFQFH